MKNLTPLLPGTVVLIVRTLGKQILTLIAALCLWSIQPAAAQSILYSQNFENFSTGTANPDAWWNFGGDAFFTWTHTVQPSGTGGSQGLVYEADGAATFGTSFYWYAGFGRSDLVGGPLSQTADNVTLSLDLAVFGSTTSPTAGVQIRVGQYSGSTNTWSATWTTSLTSVFSTFLVTLDTGVQTGTYDPSRDLSIDSISFNDTAFGLDDNNLVIIDNVVLSSVPEPSSLALFGVGSMVLAARLRRRSGRSLFN